MMKYLRKQLINKKGLGKANTPIMVVAAFLAPALILFLIFVIYPLLKVFRISFFSWRGITAGAEKFVGLENFKNLFTDPIFWQTLFNNISLFIFVIIISVTLALLFAFFLTNKIKMNNLFRATWLFPNMLSDIVVVTIWLFIYHPTMGMLNFLLTKIGIQIGTMSWLGNASTALIAVSIPMIWKTMGFFIVLFYAAMQEIPESILEASKIDGASKWREFFSITLPLIKPTIGVAIVFLMYNSFSLIFTYVKFLTDGGPYRSTEVLPTYIYQVGFEYHEFGYASAISVFSFLVISIFAVIAIRMLMKQLVHGEHGL